MNKSKTKNFNVAAVYSFPASLEADALMPRRLAFFDIFSEIHSSPEDVDSSKFLHGHAGRLEDRRQIRKYFKKAISGLEMSRACT
ncbi:MAG: hypothetical protein OXJ38_02250 [Gammaproteobacteria bacterium]|nr:hypothetical protein [Gammaproteobacteria bacterium]